MKLSDLRRRRTNCARHWSALPNNILALELCSLVSGRRAPIVHRLDSSRRVNSGVWGSRTPRSVATRAASCPAVAETVGQYRDLAGDRNAGANGVDELGAPASTAHSPASVIDSSRETLTPVAWLNASRCAAVSRTSHEWIPAPDRVAECASPAASSMSLQAVWDREASISR